MTTTTTRILLTATTLLLASSTVAHADDLAIQITGPVATPGVKPSGRVKQHVIRWTDARGSNVAVLSETRDKGTATLYVDHFVGRKRVGKIREKTLKTCVGDMSAEGDVSNLTVAAFVPATFAVLDTDGDKVGELMFGYRVGCEMTDDALTAKLIVLEDGAKRAWRGTVAVDSGGAMTPGRVETDVTAPDALVKAARSAWSHLGDRVAAP